MWMAEGEDGILEMIIFYHKCEGVGGLMVQYTLDNHVITVYKL